MKNIKLFGIIAAVVVIGFSMAACGDGAHGGYTGGGGGSYAGGGGGTQIPARVEGIRIEPLSSSSIRITWDAVADATSYNIYLARGSNPALATTHAGTSATNSFTHTGLPASTVFSYRVVAVNSAGMGPAGGRGGHWSEATFWGGGGLAVTGFILGTGSAGSLGVWVLDSSPATFEEFDAARRNPVTSFVTPATLRPTNNVFNWWGHGTVGQPGDSAPPDGTYTIVIGTRGSSVAGAAELYRFDNITVTGGGHCHSAIQHGCWICSRHKRAIKVVPANCNNGSRNSMLSELRLPLQLFSQAWHCTKSQSAKFF